MREGVPASAAVAYGGFWRRVAAALVDGIILMIVIFPVEMALGMFAGSNLGRPRPASFGLVGAIWLFSTALNVSYQGYFLSQKGATPGKMLLGLQVIAATGGRISVGRAIARYFAQFLSALIFGIGYIMVALDSQKRALHDHICNTRVIREG
jgi:uncharacterized RDD family membrane protein YckC